MITVKRTNKPQSLVDNAATWTTEYLAARAALEVDPKSISLKQAKSKAEN